MSCKGMENAQTISWVMCAIVCRDDYVIGGVAWTPSIPQQPFAIIRVR